MLKHTNITGLCSSFWHRFDLAYLQQQCLAEACRSLPVTAAAQLLLGPRDPTHQSRGAGEGLPAPRNPKTGSTCLVCCAFHKWDLFFSMALSVNAHHRTTVSTRLLPRRVDKPRCSNLTTAGMHLTQAYQAKNAQRPALQCGKHRCCSSCCCWLCAVQDLAHVFVHDAFCAL